MTKQSDTKDRHAITPQGYFSLHDSARDDNLPKAYKQGWVEFYKLRFKVDKNVLIPRPETELLVDAVLDTIKDLNPKPNTLTPITIIDVGTGSGAIAISITKNLSTSQVDAQIIATDVSKEALKIAKQNAKLHGVLDKITFIESNLLSKIPCSSSNSSSLRDPGIEDLSLRAEGQTTKPYTLIIVTNLPYIPTARIPYLDSSVKDFEPLVALDGGEDGFELYRKLFQQISLPPRRWKPKLIVGEIDYTHGEIAVHEAQKYFPAAEVTVIKDLAHLQRILTIKQKLPTS